MKHIFLPVETLLSVDGIISIATLTVLEIVLGIDNIIFISITADKLPKAQQNKARITGLALALLMRILMLLSITWIISMKEPLFSVLNHEFSVRDFILFSGGVFLLVKTTLEIHSKTEGGDATNSSSGQPAFLAVVFQIVLIDIIFSFDSILTAIGLVQEVTIMIIAVVISMIIMLLFSKAVSEFINRHPTVKMLALSFLIMIGVILIAEAFHASVPKGYIYFSIAFAFGVEMLNMRVRKKESKK